MIASKYYKPEVLTCPKCKSKLIYRYAISKKTVCYSNGKKSKIHNLAYSCPNCKDSNLYSSQTANKIAFRGYTYSNKVICMIAKLKNNHMSREEICDYCYTKGISISDRNVDNLYKKYIECRDIDTNEKILKAYERMMLTFGQIRLSVDLITIEDSSFVIIYDYFELELLGFREFHGLDDPDLAPYLKLFMSPNLNITLIASIRKDSIFIPLLKSLCPAKTKFVPFVKY